MLGSGALQEASVLVTLAEFTLMSEQVQPLDAPGMKEKYLVAKAIQLEEKTTLAHMKGKIACKMQVLKEMSDFVQNSRRQFQEKVTRQRRHVAALLQLRKTWNLSREKQGLALYLGNNRYGLDDIRVSLTTEDPLKYTIPTWIQTGQVLEITFSPIDDIDSEQYPVPMTELEQADAYCRDKAMFEEMSAEARSCGEFLVISKAPEELVVEAVTSDVVLRPRVRFAWGECEGKETLAKGRLVALWRKQKDKGKKDTLKLFIDRVAHKQIVQFVLKVGITQVFYQVLSRYPARFCPIPQFLSPTHTQFHIYNGVRQICILDLQQTRVQVGFCSHVLLKIGDSVLAGLPPGALRPVPLSELGKLVEISLAAGQKELLGSR